MLLKITGGVLIMAATSIWGWSAAEKLRNQYEQLRYLEKVVCMLRSEIRYARSYLGEAFRQIGRTAKSPYKEWLLNLDSRMEERNGIAFDRLWEECSRKYLKDAGLPKGAFEKLTAFGSQLGVADAGMQIKILDLYLEEIRQTMEEHQEEMRTKMRLCHCLGVMSGIFITILLC